MGKEKEVDPDLEADEELEDDELDEEISDDDADPADDGDADDGDDDDDADADAGGSGRGKSAAKAQAEAIDPVDAELAALEQDAEDADIALAGGGKLKKLFDRQNKLLRAQNEQLRAARPSIEKAESEMRWQGFEQDAGLDAAAPEIKQQYSRKALGKAIGKEFALLMENGRYDQRAAHVLATDRVARRIKSAVIRAAQEAERGDDATEIVPKKITKRPPGARLSPPAGNAARSAKQEATAEEACDQAMGSLTGYDPGR